MRKRLTPVLCLLAVAVLCTPALSAAALSESIDVLLLGTDEFVLSVTGNEEVSRSDAILVLNVDRKTSALKLLNIERDYLVNLPDGLGPNKLCTATYFGGPQMGLEAVNGLLDLDVSLFVQIDIESAIKIIDLFGGIQVEIFENELDIIMYPPFDDDLVFSEAGVHTLNGTQALAVVRSRDHRIDVIDSNRGRNERQLRVLMACLDLFREMGLKDKLEFIGNVLPLIRTNISMGELLPLAAAALGGDIGQIAYMRTPQGSYQTKSVNMHKVIVANDMQQEIGAVHSFLNK